MACSFTHKKNIHSILQGDFIDYVLPHLSSAEKIFFTPSASPFEAFLFRLCVGSVIISYDYSEIKFKRIL